MSGFAGIARADGGTPDAELIERMAERLAFRGPDAKRVWLKPGAGFCFTFLRTGPAPQAESQPISLDGKIWLLGDVRLDSRDELKQRLGQSGEKTISGVTDEELVLRAWRLWGEKSFEVFSGDYSFALWDSETKKLCCVRDLMGTRPFFYAHLGAQLIFSNTLDVVRLSPDVSAKLDKRFIGDFLLQAWCPDAVRTAFQDIRRLPAGHVLSSANGKVSVRRFAGFAIEEPLPLKRPEDYVEEFRSHLERAVRDRLPLGSAGVFMSGGLDSTSVAAMSKKVIRERGSETSLRAHTVSYTPLFNDDESLFASSVAEHLSIPIEILAGASSPPFDGWAESAISSPEPCSEPFLRLNIQHYRQLAAGARVALTGDGGDDILTGRAWPYLAYLLRRARVGTIAWAFSDYTFRYKRFPPLRAGIRARVHRWLGRADGSAGFPGWLEPRFERELRLRDRWKELQQPVKEVHPLHSVGYASLTSSYWPNMFENEDAGWTGVAVETRAPLLDQKLLRFLLRVPPVPWCMNKELLRESMAGLLPEEVRLRKKTPLLGDPLMLHTQKNGWKATIASDACERLKMFVDCKMLTATSHPAVGSTLWADLRPIALDFWLKSVENEQRIP